MTDSSNTVVVIPAEGFIQANRGTVVRLQDDGSREILQPGMVVHRGDQLIVGHVGGALVVLSNGQQLFYAITPDHSDVGTVEPATETAPEITPLATETSQATASQQVTQPLSSVSKTASQPQVQTDLKDVDDTLEHHGFLAATHIARNAEEIQLGIGYTMSGKLVMDDEDNLYHLPGHGLLLTGSAGTLAINADGQWQYQLFTTGGSTSGQITDHFVIPGTGQYISIGVNTTPEKPALISGVDTGVVTEELTDGSGNLLINGVLTIRENDQRQAHFQAESITGQYGGLTINSQGQWAYQASNGNPLIQELGTGHQLSETFTIHSGDGTPKDIHIVIQGTNDLPVITGIDSAQLNSAHVGARMLHAPGTLDITDVDLNEDHFKSEILAGKYGSFLEMHADGSWIYSVDRLNPDVIKAPVGSQLNETFAIHSADGTTHTITATVLGGNTPAIITGVSRGLSTEDHTSQATGHLSILDPDTGQDHFQSGTQQGKYGQLQINAAGVWQYHLDNSNSQTQGLRGGETGHETFFIKSADGTPHAVGVEVFGENDKAIIGGVDSGLVKEDTNTIAGELISTGKLSIQDRDHGEDLFPAQTIRGQYGQLHLATDGTWGYIASNGDPRVQHLGEGESLSEKITIVSADGTHHDITIAINGTNDLPALKAITDRSAIEDGQTLTGQISATDTDTHDTSIFSSPATPGFSLQKDGQYNFDPANAAYQHLKAGEIMQVTIPVTITDSAGATNSHDLVITVTGTNDAAVITNKPISVTEDSNQSATIHLGISDADTNEDHFKPGTISGSHGQATVAVDGTLVYRLDNSAAQHLNVGQSITDVITVTSKDGTTHDVSVTINGTNDNPIINAITAQSAKEDGSQVTGNLTATDVDTGDTATYTTTSNQAGFTLNADGSYTLDPTDANFQHLAAGESQTLIIPITATDTHGGTSLSQNLLITITGTNDIPIVSAPVTLLPGTEDLTQTITPTQLLAHAKDIDTTDTLDITNITVDHGMVTIDTSGTAHYTPEANYNGQVTFTYQIVDGHGGVVQTTATTNLVAVQDAAVITGVDTGSVQEEHTAGMSGMLSANGQLQVTDVDAGEAKFDSQFTGGQVGYTSRLGGHLVLTPDGSWSYEIDNSKAQIQTLSQGEHLTDTVTIHSVDGTTHDIQITIAGTNDIPALSFRQTTTTTGTLSEIDVDINDTHIFETTNGSGLFGTLTVDPDTGAYAYTQNPSVAGMNFDKSTGIYSGKDVFEVKVSDNHGGSESKFITFNPTATLTATPGQQPTVVIGIPPQPTVDNLAPTVIQPSQTLSVTPPTIDLETHSDTGRSDHDNLTQDQTPTLTGHTDIPFSKVEIFAGQTLVATTYSNANGAYRVTTSTLTDSTTAYDLTAKASIPNGMAFSTSTPLGVTVDTQIHGQNDSANAVEDQTGLVHGNVLVNDDTLSTVTTTGDIAGKYGTYHINADGSYTYRLDNTNADVQALAKGATLPDPITYAIIDGAGNTTSAQLTTRITGTNDGAVIQEVMTGSTTEDRQRIAKGELSVADVDNAEDHFQANSHINGQYGYLDLQSNGKWIYHLNNRDHTVQALAAKETLQDVITVTSTDGTTYDLKLVVNGLNDNPRLRGIATKTLSEDTQVSGNAHVIDIDRTDTHLFSVKAPVAGFSIDKDTGHYSFDASNAAYQHLQVGQSQRVVVDLAVADNNGGTAHRSIVFVVRGTNDAPVVGDVDLSNTNEDQTLIFHNSDLLSKTTDVENDALHISNIHVDPRFGIIVDRGMGNYEFRPRHDYNGKDVHITFDVGDGRATTHGTALVDVIPVNDRPVVHTVDLGHIDEDTSRTFSETELLQQTTDVDTNHNLLQVQNVHVNPAIGQISGDRVSGFVFTPNPNWNGQNLHLNFDVVDDKGAKGSGHALLDVTPVQDPSIITKDTTSPQDLSVTEDLKTDSTASGKLNIQDPDAGDDHFQATSTVTGQYGILRVVTGGQWTYTLNNANAHVQELNAGEQIVDNVQIHAKDGTAYTVQIVVAGSNDIPVITSVGSVSAREDGGQVSGQIDASDVDKGDVLTYTLGQPVAGLTIDPITGAYSFNPGDTSYQHLQEGQQQTILAEVLVTDSHGGSASQQLAIAITGTNDIPAVQDVKLASINEDTSSIFQASDLLAHTTDLDQDNLAVAYVRLQDPSIGSISEDGKGGYTFKPNQNYNGQNVKFDFGVTDGKTTQAGVAHIDVLPINDAPVVHAVNLGQTVQAITFTDTELLHRSSDVDHDALSMHGTPTVDAKYGHILDNGNGSYTFIPSLGSGKQTSIHVPIHFTVTDGQAETTGIANLVQNPANATVHNTIIQDVVIGQAVEDHIVSATGTMTAHDPDGAQFDHFQTVSAQKGRYGTLSMGTNGHWTYTLTANGDPAIQGLAQGAVTHDSFVIHSADGTAHTLKIPIQGTDDKAIITPQYATAAVEDSSPLTARGKLDISDVDQGEAAFKAINYISATQGHLQIDAQGQWIYHLNNNNPDVQKLGAGEHLTDTVHVQTVSGQTYTLKVVINGTNDKPVISAISAQDSIEGGAPLHGSIVATDVDTTDTRLAFSMQNGQHAPAGFVLKSDGSYTFDPKDPAYSNMAAHQTRVLNIPITVSDGHGGSDTQVLQIAITGTNTAPRADAHVDLGATREDIPKTFTEAGLISAVHGTDLDHDNLHIQNMRIDHGTIQDDGNGHFSFKPDANYHHDNVPLTYEITDGQKSVTVYGVLDLTSVNDKPVVRQFSLGTINEDGEKHFSAQDLLRHASDVDHDNLSLVGTPTIDAKYGVISGDATHGFTFKPTPDFHGNALPIHFTVTDGTAPVQATAKINVRSVDDPAVITDVITDHATEDSKLTATGQLEIRDADGPQFNKMQASSYMAGHFGHLEIDSAGKWVYSLDQNYKVQYLAQGEVYTEHFSVRSADGTTHAINVDIQGSNDAGSITGNATATILENTATATGKLTIHDIDSSEIHAVANPAMQGAYGHLQVMANGQWVYHLDRNAKVEALHQGETHTEKFTVTSVDGAHKDILVTVKGVNDAPVITGQAVLTHSDEDTTVTISTLDLLQNSTDVDNTDTMTVENITADHGTIVANGSGGYTYTPDPDFNGQETFRYEVHDNHGAKVTTTMIQDIDPVFDVGMVTVNKITSDNIINAVESQTDVIVSGTATGGDIGTGDGVSFTINGTRYSAVVDSHGKWNAQVAGADLVAQPAFNVNVTSTDGSASGISTTSHTVNIDTQIAATITIDSISADNIINASESAALIAVTGMVGGDVQDGDKVTLHVNGKDIEGVVHGGMYSINVPGADLAADHNINASVTVSDTAQNSLTAMESHAYTVDTSGVAHNDQTSTTEDQLTTSGNVLSNDEPGATVTSPGDIHTKFGTYHIEANGDFTYTLNSPKMQDMAVGSSETDTVSYTMVDAAGNTSAAVLTTTIHGTNDKPVLDSAASVLTGTVVEDARANIVMGYLDISDVDIGDSHTIAVDPQHDGQYGQLTLHGDRWEYALDNSNQHVNALLTGETMTDTIRVQIDDGHGGTLSQEISIEIQGHSILAPSLTGGVSIQVQADEPESDVDEATITPGEADTQDMDHLTDAGEMLDNPQGNQPDHSDLAALIAPEPVFDFDRLSANTDQGHPIQTPADGTPHLNVADILDHPDTPTDSGEPDVNDLLAHQPKTEPVVAPVDTSIHEDSGAADHDDSAPDTASLDAQLVDTDDSDIL